MLLNLVFMVLCVVMWYFFIMVFIFLMFIFWGMIDLIKLGLLFLLINIFMFFVWIVDVLIGCFFFVFEGWDMWFIC